MKHDETVSLAQTLIQKASITPDDLGCQTIIADYLTALGFTCKHLPFGKVSNLWAIKGNAEPVFVFAGHTDVVPPGPPSDWTSPPFEAHIQNDTLIGRGAADMKGAIAAMLTACKRFLADYPDHQGSIAFLITSDEEGPAVDGTVKVIDHLQDQGQALDWCVVGEASSEEAVGDSIKVGRRGSLHATLTVKGQQGHIAYPERVKNPIFALAQAITAITKITWDQGTDQFPATSCQISNIQAGDGTENMVPGQASAQINWRFSPVSTPESIQQTLDSLLNTHCDLPYELEWRTAALPFAHTSPALLGACDEAITSVTDHKPKHSTSGGTSDGRFIAPSGCQVVEIGVRNHSIHQIDEQVPCKDLTKLSQIYQALLAELLLNQS